MPLERVVPIAVCEAAREAAEKLLPFSILELTPQSNAEILGGIEVIKRRRQKIAEIVQEAIDAELEAKSKG